MRRVAFVLVLSLPFALAGRAHAADDPPETVVVTYAPKPGTEADNEALVRAHFATVTKLHLVTRDAHVTYRDKDAAGRPIVVDILTWKNHAIPDNAPAELLAIWTKMEAACEKRDGHVGIAIREVQLLR
jgi:hypothetical protein